MARWVLMRFDQAPIADHHRVTRSCLPPGFTFALSLGTVCCRRSNVHLRGLQSVAARLACISIVERDIEGKHALAHHAVGHLGQFSPPLYSLALRMPEIKRRLDSDPDTLTQLGKCCDRIPRHPRELIRHLGLGSQKGVLAPKVDNLGLPTLRAVKAVLYITSGEAQFDDLGFAKEELTKQSRAKAKRKSRAVAVGAPSCQRVASFAKFVAGSQRGALQAICEGVLFLQLCSC